MLAFALHSRSIRMEHSWVGVPKSVDGLIDIANRVETVGGTQQIEQLRLQSVGILKLVHQNVIELTADALASFFVLFEQPHSELFEIGKIERTLSGLAASVKRIKARDRLQQSDTTAGVILTGYQRYCRGNQLILDALDGVALFFGYPSQVTRKLREDLKIVQRHRLALPLAQATGPLRQLVDAFALARDGG